MGRKIGHPKGESFLELNKRKKLENLSKKERIRKQYEDLHKLVPVYELNRDNEEANDSANRVEEEEKKRKRPPLRNAGDSSKFIRLSDIKKDVAQLATNLDRKRLRKKERAQRRAAKRQKLNGSGKSNGDSFIELEDLKAGPLISVHREHRTNFVEEEENTNYFVTTPSDDENNSSQQNGPSISVSTFMETNFESDDSEESFGIDLMEESEGGTDEEEELGESDADFINDSDNIEEQESDELDHLEAALEKRRKPTKQIDSDMLMQDEYDSSGDEDFNMDSEESVDDEEMESGVSVEELDDLLKDICGGDSSAEEFNESDEERVENLDPAGLKLKPIGVEIPGYTVDESVQKFVSIESNGYNENSESQTYSLFGFSAQDEHSVYSAVKAFKWLIWPFDVQTFFQNIYSKRAMVIHRSDSKYYDGIFSLHSFYGLFQMNFLDYGVNVNIANYTDGVRTTHNPSGRVYAGAIKSFVQQGMSVQCVNPQSFDKNLHYLCDILQELFNCFVGTNCYYTPAGSAGFAPHYDDIDAFLVQTCGRKHWKVYAPSNDDLWPLESSHNFSLEEMEERKDNLVFDGWLETGDILYLPRGFIHCASTDSKYHSLHVTISVTQNHSYCNLLEKVTSKLLEAKTAEIPQLRRNLPIDLLDIVGVANSEYDNEAGFQKFLETPISLYLEQFQVGLTSAIPAAVDEIGRDFMRKALPPLLTDYEKMHSIHGIADHLPSVPKFKQTTEVRFIRKHTQRLLFESEEKAFLIHRLENSMVYEGRPEVTVDVPSKFINGIEKLLKSYPNWESIENIGKKLERNIAVAEFLYNKGLLMVRKPEKQVPIKKKGQKT